MSYPLGSDQPQNFTDDSTAGADIIRTPVPVGAVIPFLSGLKRATATVAIVYGRAPMVAVPLDLGFAAAEGAGQERGHSYFPFHVGVAFGFQASYTEYSINMEDAMKFDNDVPIEPGKTYTARNQGTAITPQAVAVTVVWVDGENVYYRKEGEQLVKQTPIYRFFEIVGHQ